MEHTKLVDLHSGTDIPDQLNNPVHVAHAVVILAGDRSLTRYECNRDISGQSLPGFSLLVFVSSCFAEDLGKAI